MAAECTVLTSVFKLPSIKERELKVLPNIRIKRRTIALNNKIFPPILYFTTQLKPECKEVISSDHVIPSRI